MQQTSNRLVAKTITVNTNHTTTTKLGGFSIRETAGAVADFNIRLAAVGGQILAVGELAANQSINIIFPVPIDTGTGVFVEQSTGAIAGVLYLWT